MNELNFINEKYWDYIGTKRINGIKKFEAKCKCCGKIYLRTKASFKNFFCYECEREIIFAEKCNSRNFKYIGGFKNNQQKEKIKVQCLKCKEIKELSVVTITENNFTCSTCSFLKKQSDFKNLVESTGEYKLLTPYILDKEKVTVKHLKCGNIYKVTPNDFKAGYRCNNCNKLKKKTREEFENQLLTKRNGEYKLVGPWISYGHRILVEHVKCGHQWIVQPTHIVHSKSNCPVCSRKKSTSKLEEDFAKEISNLNLSLEYKTSDRKLLNGLEIDLLIKSKNLAIEINGTYWHSYPLKKKNYHFDKFELCKEKKINLISVFESDIVHKKNIILNKIDCLLNNKKDENLKTNIFKIDKDSFNEFQQKNSLENLKIKSKFKLCTKDKKNNIIAIMGFSINCKNNILFCKINHFSGNYKELKKFEKYIIDNYNVKEFRIEISKNYLEHLHYKKFNYKILKNIKPKKRFINNNKEISKKESENKKFFAIFDSGSYLMVKKVINQLLCD